MKRLLNVYVLSAICLLLFACEPYAQVTPSVVSSLPINTVTPVATRTPEIIPTPTRPPPPTARSLIEEEQIPKLLETSFSIMDLKALNDHMMRRITGWEYGFKDYGSGFRNGPSYQWLDVDHILMRPVIGDVANAPIPFTNTYPAVINLFSGEVWVPVNGKYTDYYVSPYWAESLGVLVSSREDKIFIYDSDGNVISTFTGELDGISPSGTKILFAKDRWMDLASGRQVDFGWDQYPEKYSLELRGPILWSVNENQVTRCCYVYGNAETGERYGVSGDEIPLDGEPTRGGLNATRGYWIGDQYVLIEQAWADMAPFDSIGFTPIFDPAHRTFRNLIDFFKVPSEYNERYLNISVSPNLDYLWLTRPTFPAGYLVNLKTRTSQEHEYVSWSPHGKYMLVDSRVLTISNNELRDLPQQSGLFQRHYVSGASHPTAEITVSVLVDEHKNQKLYFFDMDTLTDQIMDLPAEFHELEGQATKIIWSPNGDGLALVTVDGSLWLLDYPQLENLEQLTSPMPEVRDVQWSPDGTNLSFVSGADIYVVSASLQP
jgi:WD40 repeat protein